MYEHEPVTKYYVLHKEAIAFFEKVLKGDRTFLLSDDTLHKEVIAFLEKGLKESRTFCPRKLDYILLSPMYRIIRIIAIIRYVGDICMQLFLFFFKNVIYYYLFYLF